MLKNFMITTAAVALLAGTAVAQDRTAQPNTTVAPAGSAQFVSVQSPEQWLATKFKGTDVIGTNNEKIGDVSDILFDKSGKVDAYIVGVGGFLGIGTKDVALAPNAFQMQPATDRENMKLRLSMTKDELKNAPEFKPYKEAARTTSNNPPPATNNRPATPATPAPAPAPRQ